MIRFSAAGSSLLSLRLSRLKAFRPLHGRYSPARSTRPTVRANLLQIATGLILVGHGRPIVGARKLSSSQACDSTGLCAHSTLAVCRRLSPDPTDPPPLAMGQIAGSRQCRRQAPPPPRNDRHVCHRHAARAALRRQPARGPARHLAVKPEVILPL